MIWVFLALVWTIPLCAGVLWILTYQPSPASQTAETVFHAMVLCIFAMAISSDVNLWVYLWRKRSSRSTRWLSKGFVWSILLTVFAVLWLKFLFMAIYDEFSEHGAFIGWFGYALILVAMVSFNLAVFWRRTHMRRRRHHSKRPKTLPEA